MEELSVTQYSKRINRTRQAVLTQIKKCQLPVNVKAKKVGATWILEVC